MPRPQERPLKINTKRLSRAQSKLECAGEITALFSCMTVCVDHLLSFIMLTRSFYRAPGSSDLLLCSASNFKLMEPVTRKRKRLKDALLTR